MPKFSNLFVSLEPMALESHSFFKSLQKRFKPFFTFALVRKNVQKVMKNFSSK